MILADRLSYIILGTAAILLGLIAVCWALRDLLRAVRRYYAKQLRRAGYDSAADYLADGR